VFEHSAKLAVFLRRRGVHLVELEKEILKQGPPGFFPVKPHIMDDTKPAVCEIRDRSVIDDFRQRLNYNYNNMIGAYGTGSMSQKISTREMIFCPMSATPEEFEFPLEKISIDFHEHDTLDKKIHKLIYQHTSQNACMITTSPLATAEGMAVLAEKYGNDVLFNKKIELPYLPEDHPVIAPIDAEAIYLNPRLGLVDIHQLADYTPGNPILHMLGWHKGCCVVSGYGVISTGSPTLEQAAHNAASAERIARFRSEVFINHKLIGGPSVAYFEPE
jgi:ribulose-5-phosphate 4-epimerase/fuculose-1-phosphate aldolase